MEPGSTCQPALGSHSVFLGPDSPVRSSSSNRGGQLSLAVPCVATALSQPSSVLVLETVQPHPGLPLTPNTV